MAKAASTTMVMNAAETIEIKGIRIDMAKA
jgi:hypothetical protein